MPLRPLLPLIRLCAATAACLLLVDALLFRSGAYYDWIKPTSTAGSVVGATKLIARYFEPARRNVLVLGNSQIAEGFWASEADAATAGTGLHFLNGAIAGTDPRVWYYLLRRVDPHADRFAAIALMVDYDVSRIRQDMTNYPLDSSYLVPLLRVADLPDYPQTFTDDVQRGRARRAIMLPLQALHEDIREFIASPLSRYADLTEYRPGWLASVPSYPGRDESLPDLPIDRQTGTPSDWLGAETIWRPRLEAYFRDLRLGADTTLQDSNIAYLREWLGRIGARYAPNRIPIVVFVVPRGPWQRDLVPPPVAQGAVAEFAADGRIVALPGDAFTDLEQPRYFFDTLHMNHAGRVRFSRALAERLAALLK